MSNIFRRVVLILLELDSRGLLGGVGEVEVGLEADGFLDGAEGFDEGGACGATCGGWRDWARGRGAGRSRGCGRLEKRESREGWFRLC